MSLRVVTDDVIAAQRALVEPKLGQRLRLDAAYLGMAELCDYAMRLGPGPGWASIREMLRPWCTTKAQYVEYWS